MLQYDLTSTRLFDAPSRAALPSEAEMFAVTIALLLVRDLSYNDLLEDELEFRDEETTAIAECIEYRLSPLARDFGDPESLRERLRRLVGLRMSLLTDDARSVPAKPTGAASKQATVRRDFQDGA